MYERVRDGQLAETAALGILLDTAGSIRLPEGEARATINSARRTVLGG